MTAIRDIFDKNRDIGRRIESVINYAADEEEHLKQEITEYEVTDALAQSYERLMTALDDGFAGGGGHEIGVWVSGFYGSGKSSFTKYFGFALDPSRTIDGEPFLKWLQNQLPSKPLQQQLATIASRHPATVIMLDLAAIQSANEANQGISRLAYWKVMEWAGYSKEEKIALLELMLEKDGKLDEFREKIPSIAKGRSWDDVKDNPLLAKTYAGKLAPEFYPDVWEDAKAFNQISVDQMVTEDQRVEQILELIERKTGTANVIFLIDEVGQFLEGMPNLILNLQGFSENLKNKGKGAAWIISTAQQTLAESPHLSKVMARFPIPIDIESSDIKEICYRRLLRKSQDGETALKKLYGEAEASFANATRLENTRHFDKNLDAEIFCRLYPFLPQHFSILMDLLRALAKSTGGIGLRSAIKVIQDVLVDRSGFRKGATLLADAEVGTLATVDVFYDTLRRDIEKANRALVETVSKVSETYGSSSTEAAVAKAIAALQLVEGFPVTRHNVSALLHPGVKAPAIDKQVEAAIDTLLEDKALPLTAIDQSLRFMSEAVSQVMQEQSGLQPLTSDLNNVVNSALRDIFTPEPSVRIGGTRVVKTQFKVLHGGMPIGLTSSKEEIETHISLVPDADLATRITQLTNESTATSNRKVQYLVGGEDTSMQNLARDIWRCEEISRRRRGEAGEPEIADYLKAQDQRAESLKRDLATALQNSFLKGSFIFRGKPVPVKNRGSELSAAARAQPDAVASDVFDRYDEAPVNAEGSLAERLLLTDDLGQIPSKHDPLDLVKKAGGTAQVDLTKPPLVSLADYLKKHGQVDGGKLLDDFGKAPYGWFKDTTRYLVAALLVAEAVKIKTGGEWLKVAGDKAAQALKNNQSFNKVDIAPNVDQQDPKARMRAAKRLEEIVGEKVNPGQKGISGAVQKHFPSLQQDYTSLQAELAAAGLEGGERAQSLNRQLTQVMMADGSEAPAVFGTEECSLYDNLIWARKVRKALDNDLGKVAAEARSLCDSITDLPRIGTAEQLEAETGEIRDKIAECLGREDFYEVAADLQNALTSLQAEVKNAAREVAGEFATHIEAEKEAITTDTDWSKLPPEDRGKFTDELEAIEPVEAEDIAGIREVMKRRLEADSGLAGIRGRVTSRIKEIEAAETPETGGGEGGPEVEEKGQTPYQVVGDEIRLALPSRVNEAADLDPALADLQEIRQALEKGENSLKITLRD